MSAIVHKPHIPPERRGLRLLLAVRRGLLDYFTGLMNREGAFAWFSLAGRKVLMMNDAAGIQHVLKDNAANYHKSHFYKVLRPFLGNSILLSEDRVWRRQRQESAPVFTAKNLEEMVPQMAEATEAMLRRWEPHVARGAPLDLNFETMWFTLDVLLRTLFHETRELIVPEMQTAITTLLREAEERIWLPVNLPQGVTARLPKYSRALNFLNETLDGLVAARRENRAYPEDLLSRLIASYGAAPDEQRQLRDQMMTFLLAGHETTANGLVWACLYLSLYPEIMRALAAEADAVLGQGPLTLDGLKNLVLARQVLDEALRIRPAVWTLSRDALAEDFIPLEDGSRVEVPPGSVVMLCTYAVHRRAAYWKNPEAFDPARFAPEAAAARPKFAYFPFGGGPRQCLGFRFAQIESVIALAMLARRYELALVPGQDIRQMPNITLRPNGPMLFHVTKRGDAEKSAAPETAKCPYH